MMDGLPPIHGVRNSQDFLQLAQENIANMFKRVLSVAEKVKLATGPRAQAVTSDGHAGPGGEKGGRLNVVG